MSMNDLQEIICGADLERWRIENGFTQGAAAHAFGLQNAKWWQLTRAKPGEPIADPVLAMLLYIYRKHPASVPIQSPENIKEFYEYLGLKDTVQDRDKFATLIGRSTPSVYRLLLHDGQPGKPVLRWTEAVLRLKLTPQESLKLMTKVVSHVNVHQTLEEDDEG
ncbi:MAG: hypothetical protein IT497_04745 [Ottowia sp.]|nr:hypothetical protein [Ottowia sp.]